MQDSRPGPLLLSLLVLLLPAAACDQPGSRDTVRAPGDETGRVPGGESGGVPGGESGGESGGDPARAPAAQSVRVWFTRGETPEAVTRQVDDREPAAAFSALVAGPTEAERARGLSSWFSDSTAGALRAVDVADGFLVVDFEGLERLIPGAGSSAGSAALLGALDSTAFQFEAVDSVEYRLDGSCRAFWEWLQRGCEVVRRR